MEIERHNLRTMNEVFDYLSKTYDDKDCLGTREFLAEEDEVQPNGKVFKSVETLDYFLPSIFNLRS